MATDEYFTPGENPDLSQIDQSLIGVDPTITPAIIQAQSQPFSLDPNTGTISLKIPTTFDGVITSFGNLELITPLPNPNLNNQLIIPTVQVGGTLMATDVVLGNTGTTNLISDSTGTYIYI